MCIMDKQNRIIVWISVILVIGITAVAAWQISKGTSPTALRPGATLGVLTEAVSPSDWTKGAKAPKVSLVEYSDFQCPACGAYYPLVEKVFADNQDHLDFTYRQFPLPQHKNALVAAYASEAAGIQGKFWEMHDLLFKNQDVWSETDTATQTFEGYAKDLGLDVQKFKVDSLSQTVKDAVQHDQQTGISAGVDSTPSFYLNGKRVQNPRSPEEFQTLIDDASSSK